MCSNKVSPKYYNALHSIFDELYKFNFTQNTYELISSDPTRFIFPAENGNYDQLLEVVTSKYIHTADLSRFSVYFSKENIRAAVASDHTGLLGEFRRLGKDGDFHWTAAGLVPFHNDKNEETYLCFLSDTTLKKNFDEKQEQLKLLKARDDDAQRYKILINQTETIVFDWIPNTGISYESDLVKDYVFADDGVFLDGLGWSILKHVHPDDRLFLILLSDDIKNGIDRTEIVIRLKKRTGLFSWSRIVLTCIYNDDKTLKHIIGTINDVDDSVETRKELEYRASFDIITGIFNQLTFEKTVSQLFLNEPDTNFAIIRMDIKRFRFINDLFGVKKGNQLLKFIAKTIKACLNDKGVCARMGSDIFSICLEYQTKNEIPEFIEYLLNNIACFEVGFRVSAIFGVCLAENKTIPINLLCDWASTAMRSLKSSSVIPYAWYDDKLRDRLIEEQEIENEMSKALQDGQFVIYLQPKHNIETGEIVGAESLVRWNHPERGLIPPDHFIPLFERNGFILDMDEYVWKETCLIIKHWLDLGKTPVPISINVSRTHAYDSKFYDKLVELLESVGVPNKYIELELTESTFVQNTTSLYKIMNDIQGRGFKFSMDDFGSGFSSLNMLKDAPVNTVKFDKDFFNDSTVTPNANTIVRHMIAMAKDLGMTVIAEGVETEEQASMLLKNGCDTAQGYFFSKPMTVAEFEKLLFRE